MRPGLMLNRRCKVLRTPGRRKGDYWGAIVPLFEDNFVTSSWVIEGGSFESAATPSLQELQQFTVPTTVSTPISTGFILHTRSMPILQILIAAGWWL
jgi:hypothetical protein